MNIMKWLLQGDVSLRYQVTRDLLNKDDDKLKSRISDEGYGKKLLDLQKENGHWGRGFYQPKWTSTHYTLLELKNLNGYSNFGIEKAINLILDENIEEDGGVNPHRALPKSDVCINGMALDYMCWFGADEEKLKTIVDFIISQHMNDGGFNCRLNYSGAVHSSLHSTLSVLEGIRTYKDKGYTFKLNELIEIEKKGIEFILEHKLYKSDKTGEIISKGFMMLSYPPRWRYDILRALTYFVRAGIPYDERMNDAIEIILSKRKKNGTWPVQAKHPGKVHFDMEKTGSESRWNTLRVLKVLRAYRKDYLMNLILDKLCFGFEKEKVKYGIGGSLLLKSWGLTDIANDIDIIISYDDKDRAIRVLEQMGVEIDKNNSELYNTELFKTYNIDGIDIDIMSNFTIVTEEGAYTYPFEEDDILRRSVVNCENVPCMSLENWFVIYSLINRVNKIEILRQYFLEKGFNGSFFEKSLKKQINKNTREDINSIFDSRESDLEYP